MEMQTTKRERISYYSYFFGQNLFYMIIASYISLFLLNLMVIFIKIKNEMKEKLVSLKKKAYELYLYMEKMILKQIGIMAI